jgi:shikimate 5-dehydrogenase
MNPNDPLPYPVEELGDALIVADAVTSPPVTRWLTEAERRGLTIQRGEEMAFAQVPIQLQYLRLQAARPESQGRRRDERTGTVERGALG